MPFGNAQETGRPVKIKDEGLTLTPNASSIDFTGAGVTGSALGDDVSESIPGGGSATWVQTAVTGTIDGVNKVFTIPDTPVSNSISLTLGRQPQEPGTDYTISGSTITYTTAPDISLAGQPHNARYQK